MLLLEVKEEEDRTRTLCAWDNGVVLVVLPDRRFRPKEWARPCRDCDLVRRAIDTRAEPFDVVVQRFHEKAKAL